MKNKIYLVNRKETSNEGDALLGEGFYNLLVERTPSVERHEYLGGNNRILRLVFKVLVKLKLYLLASLVCFIYAVLVSLTGKPKLIIIGGGQLLLPNSTFSTALRGWVWFAKYRDVKIVAFSVGTEDVDNNSFVSASFLKTINSIDGIWVRDKYSQSWLLRFAGKESDLVPDVAYGLYNRIDIIEPYSVSGIAVCSCNKESIIKYSEYTCYKDFMTCVIDHVRDNWIPNEPIVLFSTVKSDYKDIDDFRRALGAALGYDNVRVMPYSNSKQILRLLQGSRIVVGARMHSLIMSQILGVAIIPIIRNEKMKSYVETHLELGADCQKKLLKEKLNAMLDVYWGLK